LRLELRQARLKRRDTLLETTDGHAASTATVCLLFSKQLRDDGLPADVLVSKFKKDISLALRRGTIAIALK
jgi:hypothetical protein